MLSLGATKNGALGADAVVFFDPAMARDFERRRKRAGHLMSKLRFVSAQLIAYLKNGLWLENARHANAMAKRMAQGLKTVSRRKAAASGRGQRSVRGVARGNRQRPGKPGIRFLPLAAAPAQSGVTIRLVTCFATSSADVDEFIAAAASIKPRG